MKARKTALPIPDGDRFWSVDIGTEEPNLQHFEMPRYTIGCALLNLAGPVQTLKANGLVGEHLVHAMTAQLHAALVGACWHNRVAVLDTPPPTSPLADLGEYGESVIEELTARYSLDQITLMGEQAEEEIRSRLGYVTRGAERAGFTPAANEAGTSPPGTAEQSNPEK